MPGLVEMDVATMSDDEIYRRLKEMGASVGPIVDSTRDVYRRQLLRLLSDDVKKVNLSQSQTPTIKVQIPQTPSAAEVAAAAVVTTAQHHINHGILKSPDDVPRFRQGRRSVTMAPSTTIATPTTTTTIATSTIATPLYPQLGLPQHQESDGTPEYQGILDYRYVATPRPGLHTGGVPTDTTPSPTFLRFKMNSGQVKPQTSYRDTILNNNIDGTKLTNGTQHGTSSYLKKTNPLFMTIFEVFMITFLVIVGYVFYQEVLSFNQAEKEFIESSAQNFQKD